MRTLMLALIMFMAGLTGCQSLEAMLSPRPATTPIALDPIYQDLMPVVGSYYALGTTTFLPLSPEDYAKVQAQQEPDDSAAITGFSPELTALTSALRHSGASSCTSSAHCQGLKPIYITTTMLSPDDAAYVLVELKTPELTLQRLYERASLTPLSALSIQASRAPLYDLSLLKKQSLTPRTLSPDAMGQATSTTTKAQTRSKHPKTSSTKPKSSTQRKYEPTPKGKTIAILTANQAATNKAVTNPTAANQTAANQAAAPKSTAPQAAAPKATASKSTVTQAHATTAALGTSVLKSGSTAHSTPAPHGALTEAMTQRAQELGVPSESERRKLQAEALRRADAAFINLQRMAPQGALGSTQLQGAMNATLGNVSPSTVSTLNTIQGAATSAASSMSNMGSGENKLSTALNAARVLSSSSQRVLGALSDSNHASNTQPGAGSVASSAADSAVFATGPFKSEEE